MKQDDPKATLEATVSLKEQLTIWMERRDLQAIIELMLESLKRLALIIYCITGTTVSIGSAHPWVGFLDLASAFEVRKSFIEISTVQHRPIFHAGTSSF
jgi:hypothetical protein